MADEQGDPLELLIDIEVGRNFNQHRSHELTEQKPIPPPEASS